MVIYICTCSLNNFQLYGNIEHTWLWGAIVLYRRWRHQSIEEHSEHEKKVAYRAMLEAVASQDGKNLPRRALRRLKVTSIEDYAKAVAANLNGKTEKRISFTHYIVYLDVSSDDDLYQKIAQKCSIL